jgi:DNA-binding beta-propeller fold protein YncE
MELGDVGNDLAIYGNRLYAVINCSNKVEVMDAATCKRIGQVEIPNCRYIRFADGYAYVTSYAGPVEIDPNYKQKGYVAKIDTATLDVVDRCIVGYQPDGLEILSGKIYVANSGGYMSPNYENTLSVINLQNFEVEDTIPIAVNLHRIAADSHGQLWISSRGDYYTVAASLSCYDTRKQRITATLPITVSDFTIKGDSLYYIGVDRTFTSTSSAANSYGIVRVSDREQVSTNFITDGTESSIVVPYGIAVNPLTGDILVADARNYVNPGRLYCFSPQGMKRWDVRTGDIPAHIAFWGSTK